MGRDKNLPKVFSAISSKTRTPHKALMYSGALIIFMAVVIPLKDVASAADIMFLLLFLQVNIAAITLRKKYGKRLKYGYLMPFFPIVPIIGIVTKLFLALFMFNYSPVAWYFTIAWIGLGTVIYYLYAKKHRGEKESTLLVHQEKSQLGFDTEKFSILVPVGNPDSLKTLMPVAINSARNNNGSILILQVVEIPEQLPLSEGIIYAEQGKEIANKALRMVQEAGLSAEILVRISHQPYDAIIQTAEERKSNLIIMGWRGQSNLKANIIGRNIDKILEKVNSEVLVVQQNAKPPLHKVLVPIANPKQIKPIINRIEDFDSSSKMELRFLHIFKTTTGDDEKERVLKTLNTEISGYLDDHDNNNILIELESIVNDNVTAVIVKNADEYDAVVIGGSHQNWFQKKFANIRPNNIALRTKSPVILYNPKGTFVRFGLNQMANYVKGGYKEINTKSEKELEKEGMLAPRGEQATLDLHTRVNKTELILSGLIAVVSSALMYVGDGNFLTWIGMGGFLIGLFWFTIISVKGAKVKKA